MGKKFLLLGASGHSEVVLETIRVLEKRRDIEPYDTIDYLDDVSGKATGK